jgi:hypothetical protein
MAVSEIYGDDDKKNPLVMMCSKTSYERDQEGKVASQ